MKRGSPIVEESRARVVLHLACVLRGGDPRFHWAGIRREWQNLGIRTSRLTGGREGRRS